MTLPEDLDSTDLTILRAIATQPNCTTRDLESIIYLSRTQVLRRLRSLHSLDLIVRRNGTPGQTYRYVLNPSITLAEIEEANAARLNINPDPIAREALEIMLSGMQTIIIQLSEMVRRIESILK